MDKTSFKALIVEEISKNSFTRSIEEKTVADLPEGDLLIKVHYSSLNYKDALSATGNRGITRKYPHTPGIDASGVVLASQNPDFEVGQEVLITGYDLGMNISGGFGQYIRIPASWAVKLPWGLSLKESMIIGTAGFTAAMSVNFIVNDILPKDGEVLVTGATGGVGTIAVALLSSLGYNVTAVSGKADSADFLTGLGASSIITREEAAEGSGSALIKSRWAAVVDTVGGDILSAAVKSTKPWGVVTCCGLVASPELTMNVFPFILRGVKMVGIDSQNCPMDLRVKIWKLFTKEWKIRFTKGFYKEIGLEALEDNIQLILKGKQKGRVLVNLDL